jgi:hypothetical protein
MDWIDRLVFGRVQIDRRCEKSWWYTGYEYIDSMVELLPIVIACGILRKIVSDIVPKGEIKSLSKYQLFINKIRARKNRCRWLIRNKIHEIVVYWFGEVNDKVSKGEL